MGTERRLCYDRVYTHTHQQETATSFLESLESTSWEPGCFICPALLDMCVMSLWFTTLWPLSGQTHTLTHSLTHSLTLRHTHFCMQSRTAEPGHGNMASCSLDLHPREAPQKRCQLLLNSPLLLRAMQGRFCLCCE